LSEPEKTACKKCRGNRRRGYNRDGSKCKWCNGTGVYTPPQHGEERPEAAK